MYWAFLVLWELKAQTGLIVANGHLAPNGLCDNLINNCKFFILYFIVNMGNSIFEELVQQRVYPTKYIVRRSSHKYKITYRIIDASQPFSKMSLANITSTMSLK
jgi:hypothetical protein